MQSKNLEIMKKLLVVLAVVGSGAVFGQRVWTSDDVIHILGYDQNKARFLKDNNYTNYCSVWLRHHIETTQIDMHPSINSKKLLNWVHENYNNHIELHGPKKAFDFSNLTSYSDWLKSVGAENSIFALHAGKDFKLSAAIPIPSLIPEFKTIVIVEYFGFFESASFFADEPHIISYSTIAVQLQDGTWDVIPYDYYFDIDPSWDGFWPGCYYFFDEQYWMY